MLPFISSLLVLVGPIVRTDDLPQGDMLAKTAGKVQAEKEKQRDPINPDRPGIADGSSVVGKGVFQIEVGVQHENHDVAGGGHQRLALTPTLLRYGLDSRYELRVESLGYNGFWQTGQTALSGYAPVSLGVKLQFQRPSEKNGQLSLGTIARVFAPVGSAGFQTQHTTGDVRLAADWTVAPHWSLNPNLGVGFYESNGSSFTALVGALTLSRDLDSRTQAFIDGGVQNPELWGGTTAAILDIGIAFLPTNDTQLDLSIGKGISGTTTPHPFIALGYSIRF